MHERMVKKLFPLYQIYSIRDFSDSSIKPKNNADYNRIIYKWRNGVECRYVITEEFSNHLFYTEYF